MIKFCLCCISVVLFSIASHAELGRVSVKGNQFVTADGNPIVFKGLDSSDLDKLDRNDQLNAAYFAAVKSWGANLVRFPVHPAAWRIRGEKEYIRLLDRAVALAKEQGLYVIIDWHSIGNIEAHRFLGCASELFPPTAYDTTKEETLDFWRTMSRRYQNDNTVAFFELFNEPAKGGNMGECTWAQWKEFMEQVIAEVRKSGGTAVPLVTGFNYAYDLKPVAKDPINAEGIGYVAHPYPMKREKPWEDKWTADWGFVAEKYPLILTEIGFCYADEKGSHIPVISDESYVDAIAEYTGKRGISYSFWVFDPQWAPSLIKDWTFEPTRSGAFIKKALEAR